MEILVLVTNCCFGLGCLLVWSVLREEGLRTIIMTQNDILRRLRYALDISDGQVVKIFAHVGGDLKPGQVSAWLKHDDHAEFEELPEVMLCRFLDGLIIEKRGARPDGVVPKPQEYLSNNEILKKIRIALTLRDEDMMDVFALEGFVVTKAELGSFFRKEGQRNFAKCPEQVLRKFLQGLGQRTGKKKRDSEVDRNSES